MKLSTNPILQLNADVLCRLGLAKALRDVRAFGLSLSIVQRIFIVLIPTMICMYGLINDMPLILLVGSAILTAVTSMWSKEEILDYIAKIIAGYFVSDFEFFFTCDDSIQPFKERNAAPPLTPPRHNFI